MVLSFKKHNKSNGAGAMPALFICNLKLFGLFYTPGLTIINC
jgi:hypothetical protein